MAGHPFLRMKKMTWDCDQVACDHQLHKNLGKKKIVLAGPSQCAAGLSLLGSCGYQGFKTHSECSFKHPPWTAKKWQCETQFFCLPPTKIYCQWLVWSQFPHTFPLPPEESRWTNLDTGKVVCQPVDQSEWIQDWCHVLQARDVILDYSYEPSHYSCQVKHLGVIGWSSRRVFPASTAWIQGPLPRSFGQHLAKACSGTGLPFLEVGWLEKACCRFLEYSWNW